MDCSVAIDAGSFVHHVAEFLVPLQKEKHLWDLRHDCAFPGDSDFIVSIRG